MGMFSRFTDIINANLNSMLDKAEHPEKMIKLIVQEMEETLVEVRTTAAKNIAEKKTLLRQMSSLNASTERWQQKAELAITKGRDDLAKSALTEKLKSSSQAEELKCELTSLDELLNDIQEDAQRLQDKLLEAKRKQQAYVLRQQSAEVRLKVREKASVHNIDEAISKFERYQQKIDQIEAQVEAYDLTKNNDLNSQFKALEIDENIEQEFAALKKRVVNG